jgi:hypothetical protein
MAAMEEPMDLDRISAPAFGHALRGLSLNLLVRDVPGQVAFLAGVFGLEPRQAGRDFAILLHAGQPFQLHSDAAYGAHPLLSLLPEAGPRGAGIEIRLHEADPDAAAERLARHPGGLLLQAPRDKPAHGLREAVILCPSGYAWVPSRRIG